MPDEQTEKPRVKTWKTIKKELDTANERLAAHDAKRAELVKVQADAKEAADAMAAKIQAELTAKPANS